MKRPGIGSRVRELRARAWREREARTLHGRVAPGTSNAEPAREDGLADTTQPVATYAVGWPQRLRRDAPSVAARTGKPSADGHHAEAAAECPEAASCGGGATFAQVFLATQSRTWPYATSCTFPNAVPGTAAGAVAEARRCPARSRPFAPWDGARPVADDGAGGGHKSR